MLQRGKTEVTQHDDTDTTITTVIIQVFFNCMNCNKVNIVGVSISIKQTKEFLVPRIDPRIPTMKHGGRSKAFLLCFMQCQPSLAGPIWKSQDIISCDYVLQKKCTACR